MQSIGTLGGTGAAGRGINDAGQVAGFSNLFGDDFTIAFVFTPGTGMQNIGSLGGGFSQALAINNAGQVTGVSHNDVADPQTFLWSPATGLVGLGGDGGFAINDAGHIAGGSRQAFLHTPGTGLVPLGTLNGDLFSTGRGINEASDVVGASFLDLMPGDASRNAFVYTGETGIVGLQSLLDPVTGRGWSLGTAYDINNNGQIGGIGMLRRQ